MTILKQKMAAFIGRGKLSLRSEHPFWCFFLEKRQENPESEGQEAWKVASTVSNAWATLWYFSGSDQGRQGFPCISTT